MMKNVFSLLITDTSEAPSLASHVRRVRVPSNVDQFSDVDQYLDDLFSPVLDGSLDELSDARSLSTSIRGGHSDFFEAPEINKDFDDLQSANKLERVIKGGGHKKENTENEKKIDREVEDLTSSGISLDDYITGEFIRAIHTFRMSHFPLNQLKNLTFFFLKIKLHFKEKCFFENVRHSDFLMLFLEFVSFPFSNFFFFQKKTEFFPLFKLQSSSSRYS